MARPKPIKLSKEDYQDAPEWFARFLTNLSPALGDVTAILSGGVTKDNTRTQVERVTITTAPNLADTFASGKLAIKCKLGVKPDSVLLAQVSGGTAANLDYAVETVTAPTFLNAWVNYDTANNNSAGYWMDGGGVVHLRGIVTNPGVVAAGSVIFTLPAAFRPSKIEVFPCVANGAFGVVSVQPDGDVVYASGDKTYFTLDGLTFRSATGSGIGVGTPQWEYTQTGMVKINYIPGLRPSTKYDLTFVIE